MRLSAATLDRLSPDVAQPGYDRAAQRRGIVHLGIGAFARAHQAVYTDAAMAAGDRDWAINGVSLRTAHVAGSLAPQDGLYTVTERGPAGDRIQVVGALREVIVAPQNPAAVTAALADRDTRIVTLTLTEKGYHLAADGSLDLRKVRREKGSIYHHLALAMEARREMGLPGLTILSCDNLADNGAKLAVALATWFDAAAPKLSRWFADECSCPATMVDRIVPAATEATLAEAGDSIGLVDAAAIVTEPFRQWVIEDRFVGSRPRWEAAGAELAADVRPYEAAKLRMLNGAHSALAYLGLAAGYSFVHEAVADAGIRPLVERLMRNEAAPTVDRAPHQDLGVYADALLARFANRALPHRLSQIAKDGSQKIGPRWLAQLEINRMRNVRCSATLAALAAWLRFVRSDEHEVDDPLAAELAACWRAGTNDVVMAIFGPAGLIPACRALGPEERAEVTRLIGMRGPG